MTWLLAPTIVSVTGLPASVWPPASRNVAVKACAALMVWVSGLLGLSASVGAGVTGMTSMPLLLA